MTLTNLLPDGRYYVSLWMVAQVLVFGCCLPHRSRFWLRTLPAAIFLFAVGRQLLLIQSFVISVPLFIRTLMGILAAILMLWTTTATPAQALYASLWAMMTQQTLQNASSVLLNYLLGWGIVSHYGVYLLVWMVVTLPLTYWGLAKPLSQGNYHVGHRHLAIAAALFIEFELVQGVPDIKIGVDGTSGLGQNYQFVLMNGICLLVALYLAHTLFVKRQAEAELAVANALRRSQKERYEAAKRNVALINRRCHELKVQLADLERARTSGEQKQCLSRLSEAVQIYDSSLATGHDVLDMVLAEQSLSCREQGIRLHCVADGAQLQFMEEADLYTLCTGLLQQAAARAGKIADPEQRELDLQVYRRQGVVVLETAVLLTSGAQGSGRALPEEISDILHKYGAELFSGVEQGCAVVRCLFPAREKTGPTKS